ncbi:MAG TPA: hypothetical protein PKZ32_05435, partial [Candidatus Melainabacteria bacterium]|nr:hypothetical protein [Candidatus Melainabacteria bacterium]
MAHLNPLQIFEYVKLSTIASITDRRRLSKFESPVTGRQKNLKWALLAGLPKLPMFASIYVSSYSDTCIFA